MVLKTQQLIQKDVGAVQHVKYSLIHPHVLCKQTAGGPGRVMFVAFKGVGSTAPESS